MSKHTVHRIQSVFRVFAVLGWFAFIFALLACMGGFLMRETGAILAAGGAVAMTVGMIFGGCIGGER